MLNDFVDDGNIFDGLEILENDLNNLSQHFFYLIKFLKDNEVELKDKNNELALGILREYSNIGSVESVRDRTFHEVSGLLKNYFKLIEENEEMLAGVGVTEEKLTNFLLGASELENSFHVKSLENKIKSFVEKYENAIGVDLPLNLEPASFWDDFDDFVDEFKELRKNLELEVGNELKIFRATSGYKEALPNDMVENLYRKVQDDIINKVATDMGIEFEVPDRAKTSPFLMKNGYLKETVAELSNLFPEKTNDELQVLAVRENRRKTGFLPKTFPAQVHEGFSEKLPNKLKKALFDNKKIMISWLERDKFNLEGFEFNLEMQDKKIRVSDNQGRQAFFSSAKDVVEFIQKASGATPENSAYFFIFERPVLVNDKHKILKSLYGVDLGYDDADSLQESILLLEKKYEQTRNSNLLKPMLALDVFARFQRVITFGRGASGFNENVQNKIDQCLYLNDVSDFDRFLYDLRDLSKNVEQTTYEGLSFSALEKQAEIQMKALENYSQSKYLQSFLNDFSEGSAAGLDFSELVKLDQICKEFIEFLNASKMILDSAFKSQPEILLSFRSSSSKLIDEVENEIERNDISNDFLANFRI